MTTQAQPPRGDAALLKAIATGSPVATNGRQADECMAMHRANIYNALAALSAKDFSDKCIVHGRGHSKTVTVRHEIGHGGSLMFPVQNVRTPQSAIRMVHDLIMCRASALAKAEGVSK